MRFKLKKINIFKQKNWLFLALALFLIVVITFYVSAKQIGASVSQICSLAQAEYKKDCVDSLILVLENDNLDFSMRNRAVWALGQLGDKRALSSLNTYLIVENKDQKKENLSFQISQSELKKAINLASGGKNMTAWLWRDKSFFQDYKANNLENFKKEAETQVELIAKAENSLPNNDNKELKLLFFGDLMLDRHVGEKIALYSLDELLSKLNEDKFTVGYDIVAANLEGAVTNEGEHYRPHNLYDFAFKPEIISSLKDYGFNFFTVANNHLSDQGLVGIEETYKNLSSLGFNYVGCQDASLVLNSENIATSKISKDVEVPVLSINNCSTRILEVKSYKLGFLAFSIVYKAINEEDIIKEIQALKEKVDWLIVLPHWGIEYESLAASSQENLAKKLIDAGADVVIGSHPHVIQNYEVYKEKPIFYSLGNFIFDQYFSKETQEGLAVSLSLEKFKEPNFEIYKIKTKGSKIELIEKQEGDK
ncbi:MAG: CapA family protein [Candidatus Pacebacteria bacterium]|nr:CapA family protein [Candidatus Paceibacterota bacterium]